MIREFFQAVRNHFTMPSAESLALYELDEAKRKLLRAQTGREYADSMCKFHEAQIKRLTAYVYKDEVK